MNEWMNEWVKEETFRFWCNPDHVSSGLGLWGVWCMVLLRDTEPSVCWVKRQRAALGLFYLHGVCLTITIIRGGAKHTVVGKFCDFRLKSPFISETVREAHDYYGTLIGCRRWRINTCRFRWPWVTHNPGFKSLYTYKSNSWKRCVLRTKLLWQTNRKRYITYRMLSCMARIMYQTWYWYLIYSKLVRGRSRLLIMYIQVWTWTLSDP